MKHFSNEIKLLIFDLDGTLVNSLPDLTDSVNHALGKINYPLINQKQTAKMVGGGLKRLLQLAIGNNDEVLFEKARIFFMEYYTKNYVSKTTYYKGVPEVLSYFSDKLKAVYSNKLHKFTIDTIHKLQLENYFVKVMGAKPELFKQKPSPEGINIILQELNVQPKHAIMIGDSTHDIEAGKLAGIFTCGVTYGYRPKELLIKTKPDFLIHDIKELKDFM